MLNAVVGSSPTWPTNALDGAAIVPSSLRGKKDRQRTGVMRAMGNVGNLKASGLAIRTYNMGR